MSAAALPQNLAAKPAPLISFTHAGLLQRKCAYGSPAASSPTAECAECASETLRQARLTTGARNDPLKPEAVEAADRVSPASAGPAIRGVPPLIQRFAGQSSTSTRMAPGSLDRVLASSGNAGQSAPVQEIEQRFRHDFSRVRVHSGATAAASERNVSTNAETAGHADQKRGPSPTALRRNGEELQNRTGMPDELIAGLEQLSGIDLSAVRVYYNSAEPAQLNALAYTQGRDIQIAPGEEKHLPHEGWHVVQQMQGRVKPTKQMKRILLNDDGGLEREADVMGAKAQALGNQAAAANYHTGIATAGGAELEDIPFAVAIAPAAQRTARQFLRPTMRLSNVPVVQRATNFAAGTVSATTNLAAHLIAGQRTAGLTPPTLNSTTILSAAAAQGALKPPVLGGQSNADGTESTWVATVPTNEASFAMQLPTGGPWSTTTTKANVAALFTSLGLAAQAGCSTPGNSTFSVNGKPTDADFAANVRTHENLHAADHKTGFNAVIVPWDTKLEAAKTAKTRFNGPTVTAVEAALFTAMGGTPNQIATAQHNKWIALNNATHTGTTTATGGAAAPSNSAANPTCTTSSLDLT
jgi:hypothetical protein